MTVVVNKVGKIYYPNHSSTHLSNTTRTLKLVLRNEICNEILILSGYNEKPGKGFYWDSQSDTGNPLVINSMQINLFFYTMKYLHRADNNQPDRNNTDWKIRPLMDNFRLIFRRFCI